MLRNESPMIARMDRHVIAPQSFDFFPQPQSWPQAVFFLGLIKRMRKMVRVTITIPAAVRVCQSMVLEA